MANYFQFKGSLKFSSKMQKAKKVRGRHIKVTLKRVISLRKAGLD
jgi:hypothetical protein